MQRRTIAALSLAALLVTAGCAGLPGADGSDARNAEQLQSDTVDAMSDVETYRTELTMNISTDAQSLTMRQRGAFDEAAELARTNTSVMGRQSTTYIDGSTLYVEIGGQWRAQNLSGAGLWDNGTSADRQRQILETGNVTVEGDATVNGTETTVLAVDPDSEDLKAFLQQQQAGQAMSGVDIENASYVVYVADETDRVRKVELSMTMTVSGQTADTNATMWFYDYGDPVNITVPSDATEQADGSAALAPVAA